jgi:gluconokinase
MPSDATPTVLLLIGVSGVGKTTVGLGVAERLGWDFFDADDLHPPANVAKMQRGEGLTDADRDPWLSALRGLIDGRLDEDAPAVIACSALKARYRRRLKQGDPRVAFVWLDTTKEAIAQRLAEREGHYAGPDLLTSQFDALEPPTPEEALRVVAEGSVDDVARRVVTALDNGAERTEASSSG